MQPPLPLVLHALQLVEPGRPEMSVDDIVKAAEEYQTHFVVVTGGEPMIAKDVRLLTERLIASWQACHHRDLRVRS